MIELEMLVVENEVCVRSGLANGGEIPVQVLLPACPHSVHRVAYNTSLVMASRGRGQSNGEVIHG